jgi:hypothetical protein
MCVYLYIFIHTLSLHVCVCVCVCVCVGIEPGALVVADVFLHKIYRFYDDAMCVGDIGVSDKTFIYEQNAIADVKDREKDANLIKVINQTTTANAYSLISSTRATAAGVPKVFAFPRDRKLTNAEILHRLKAEMSAFAVEVRMCIYNYIYICMCVCVCYVYVHVCVCLCA